MMSRLRKFARDPLLQFLLLGAVIYLGAQGLGALRAGGERTIVVDRAVADRLARLHQAQYGAPPSPAQAAALVDQHVRDEALYREALRLHLGAGDEIVRRRLIQKMEFLDNDLAATPEPSEDALRGYFQAHAASFAPPATVTFHHLYFSPDRDGDAGARARAEHAVARLQRGADWKSLGDPFPLQANYAELTAENAAQVFGDTPVSSALFEAPSGRWSAPLKSGYGWHLVFVDERAAPRLPAYAAVRDQVRAAVLRAGQDAANRTAESRLLARYRVVRQDLGPRK
ncbi:MAG: peptidylprolyl isomerase [Caulobacteraceae bacterium]